MTGFPVLVSRQRYAYTVIFNLLRLVGVASSV